MFFYNHYKIYVRKNIFVTITKILFSHSDHEAQPWGGPRADKNGGAGAEPPLPLAFGLVSVLGRRVLGVLFSFLLICFVRFRTPLDPNG